MPQLMLAPLMVLRINSARSGVHWLTTAATTTSAMKIAGKFPSLLGRRMYSAAIPAAKKKYVPAGGTYPQGFRVSGTVVGVKPGNTTKPDLAFITSDTPCAAAAVFTKNKFQAAPVTFSRTLLQQKRNAGLQGVLINSGCANAVTGKGGLGDAAAMAAEADKALGAESATIVMSTGVIGQRFVLPCAQECYAPR